MRLLYHALKNWDTLPALGYAGTALATMLFYSSPLSSFGNSVGSNIECVIFYGLEAIAGKRLRLSAAFTLCTLVAVYINVRQLLCGRRKLGNVDTSACDGYCWCVPRCASQQTGPTTKRPLPEAKHSAKLNARVTLHIVRRRK